MPNALVLDLSHHNTVDDFDAAAKAGIVGIIHKATEGSDYVDDTYVARRAEAVEVGLLWGAYHFLRPGDMKQQAQFFIDNAMPDANTLLAADHEDSGVSLDDLKQFLSTVRSITGREPVLYSGNVIKEQLGNEPDAELAQYPLWLTQYTSGDPSWPTATWATWWLWQYTSSAECDGITGDVDCNTYQDTAADLILEWSGTPIPDTDNTVTVAINAPPGVKVSVTINGVDTMV